MKNILIVEDESAIADAIIYAVESEGFMAIGCSTLQQAWIHFRANRIDFIVLDIGLPDGNGFDFCRELRKESDIPVLFLSARQDEIDRVAGLELGGDDYMVKPFSPRELTARIRAIFRRMPGPGPVPVSQEAQKAFIVDDHRKQITYFGKAMQLTRYEYRILNLLIQRPGWVFSRDQIMSAVWEEPDASMDRTVDTHIKIIRAKLEAIKSGYQPIITHRGQGYSLKISN